MYLTSLPNIIVVIQKFLISGTNFNNYTGDGQKLNLLNIDLLGLHKSLEGYYE